MYKMFSAKSVNSPYFLQIINFNQICLEIINKIKASTTSKSSPVNNIFWDYPQFVQRDLKPTNSLLTSGFLHGFFSTPKKSKSDAQNQISLTYSHKINTVMTLILNSSIGGGQR